MAVLIAIYTCANKGLPMKFCESIKALEGLGLAGDRYALQKGSWKEKGAAEHKKKRNITIIADEDIVIANRRVPRNMRFRMPETRRNLVTRSLNPLDLIGKEFEIGTARFLGIEHAAPCARPGKLVGKQGFEKAFEGLGGLNAVVLKSGIITWNDKILVSSVWF